MKKAILMISFGTSHLEQLERAIFSVIATAKTKFQEEDVYDAFSSGMIRAKLKREYGKHINGIEESFELLKERGYEEVTVQPMHLLRGKEYEKVRKACEDYRESLHIKLGETLLANERDYRWIVGHMKEVYHENESLLLVLGHGTDHEANEAYRKLASTMTEEGLQGVVSTLQCLEDIGSIVGFAEAQEKHTLTIMPFMLVAGNHVTQDIIGMEEHKWQGALSSKGLDVEIITTGLGEYPFIHELFIQHIKEAKPLD